MLAMKWHWPANSLRPSSEKQLAKSAYLPSVSTLHAVLKTASGDAYCAGLDLAAGAAPATPHANMTHTAGQAPRAANNIQPMVAKNRRRRSTDMTIGACVIIVTCRQVGSLSGELRS